MKTVMTPTLHLNGSSPEHLKEELREAIGSLGRALAVMGVNGPNARDYYVKGEDAFGVARREHDERLRVIRGVLAEYEQILDSIQEQIDDRAARRTGR